MGDILFTRPMDVASGWQIFARTSAFQLAILDTPSPYRVDAAQFGDIAVAVLSNDVEAAEILDMVRLNRELFVDGLRLRWPAAGIIWNTRSGEFCVFRDIFGFIVWGVSRIQRELACTTSPDAFAGIVRGRPLNDARMAAYLLETEDNSRADFFEHTERILPGECLFWADSIDGFIDSILGNTKDAQAYEPRAHHVSYWKRRNYGVFDATYDELVPELRQQLMDAAGRIGAGEDVCFTLSGGLDSSGILAAYCAIRKNENKKFDAVSLVSREHPECDESSELSVLEAALPIQLKRVNMDAAWPVSRPESYESFGAWGPPYAPGIETSLAAYEAVERDLGTRTIITGHGGNLIVKVRLEAMWRHLLSRMDVREIAEEIGALTKAHVRYLATRTLANSFDGRLYTWLNHLRGRNICSVAQRCMKRILLAQFEPAHTDLYFSMSHIQERQQTPQTWRWEYIVRSLDRLARQTHHRFYDPLFDPVLYDFCAQIPPQYFMRRGEYRKLYKDALSPLLPAQILAHPKCKSFSGIIEEGIAKRAIMEINKRISQFSSEYIDSKKLLKFYHDYTEETAAGCAHASSMSIWRPLSLCYWKRP